MTTHDNFFTGHWILVKPRRINRNATYKCSVCGKLCSSYYNDVGEWKYCPHCGRPMPREETPQKYFTPKEVRNMSPSEVKENYTAIMDSMKKWK